MSRDTASIRDQLGNDSEIFPLLVPDFNETVTLIEGPISAELRDIGHGWVVGSDTNAIVGDWTGTSDGEQLVVGDYSFTASEYVFNKDNLFIERFRFNNFEDTSTTTASVDYTTNHRIDFTSGEIYQSKIIHKDGTNITSVKFTATVTGTLTIQVSADGTHYETVTLDTTKTLSYPASTGLYYKITESGASTATVSDVIIKING